MGGRCWVLVKLFIPQFEDKQLVYSCLVYLSTLCGRGVNEVFSPGTRGQPNRLLVPRLLVN
jgi:hypothetical protein